MFTENDANRLQGAVLNPLACQYPFVDQLLTSKRDMRAEIKNDGLVGSVSIVNIV